MEVLEFPLLPLEYEKRLEQDLNLLIKFTLN